MIVDAPERLWSRTLHGLGFLSTVAAAAGLAASVYFPLSSREAALERQLASAWRLLDDSETISRRHAAAQDALQAAEDRIRTVREQIPETAQEARFMEQLNRLAGDVDFEVLDYRPGTAEPHDFCQQIRVQVRGRGTYESICRFLTGIDGLPRVCRAVGVGIDAQRSAGDDYDVDMTLTIFFGVRQEALDAATEKENRNG